jgi:hypothetical protein
MTNEKLNNIIIKLRCCASVLADEIATNLAKGGCDLTVRLIILEDSIALLKKYNLDNEDLNCLTYDEFEAVLQNAVDLCKLCNCGSNTSLILD